MCVLYTELHLRVCAAVHVRAVKYDERVGEYYYIHVVVHVRVYMNTCMYMYVWYCTST